MMSWFWFLVVFVGFFVFNLRKWKPINMAKLIVISKGLSKNLTLLQVATFTLLLQKPHLSISTSKMLLLINSPGRKQRLMGSSQSQSGREWLSAEAGSRALPAGLQAVGMCWWHWGAHEGVGKWQEGTMRDLGLSILSSLPKHPKCVTGCSHQWCCLWDLWSGYCAWWFSSWV